MDLPPHILPSELQNIFIKRNIENAVPENFAEVKYSYYFFKQLKDKIRTGKCSVYFDVLNKRYLTTPSSTSGGKSMKKRKTKTVNCGSKF